MRLSSFFLSISPIESNLFYLTIGSEIGTNDVSRKVVPTLIFEGVAKDVFLDTNISLWMAVLHTHLISVMATVDQLGQDMLLSLAYPWSARLGVISAGRESRVRMD